MTADFAYGLHGDVEPYASGYSDDSLDRWAARLHVWRAGGEPPDALRIHSFPALPAPLRDVYVYFENDIKVHAPFDAEGLARRMGVERDG